MGVPNCVSGHLFVLLWESGCSPPIPIREAIFAGKSFSPSKMLAHDVCSNDPACCSSEGKLPISSGCMLLIKWHRLGDPLGREGWRIGKEGGSIWTVAAFAACGSAAAPMNSALTAPALQPYAQNLHRNKPAKTPAWVEEELVNSHTCLRNYYQPMDDKGGRVRFLQWCGPREIVYAQLHTGASLNGQSISLKPEF